jgi:signal transduction histidine kinase
MVLTGGVMALLTIGVFALLFVAIGGLRDAGEVADRSVAVANAANRLEKLVIDIDTGSRGFALTKDQRFLRSFNDARDVFPREAADFVRLSAGDNADQGRRAREIVRDGTTYLRDYPVRLVDREQSDPSATRSKVASGAWLQHLASLRQQFSDFEDAQHRIAEVREHHSIDAVQRAAGTAAGGATALLLLIMFSILYLTRSIVRPVRRTSALAGELAKGKLGVRMPETSPGELGVLECELNTMAASLEASRDRLGQIVEEQSSLRRVATLVARGLPPQEVLAAVAAEMGRVLGAEHSQVVRFEPDNTAIALANWSDPSVPAIPPPLGGHWTIEDGTISGEVLRTGRPARVRGFGNPTSGIGKWRREQGIRHAAGCPVKVEGRLWGVVIIFSRTTELEPETSEARMQEFMELVGTAISNAQSRSDLLASRARVVAASDESRRRIERNLHDGAQQQLITLILKLRTAETTIAPCQQRLREQLSGSVTDLCNVTEDLQEISRGLVPLILTRSGLCPALKALARRSPIPVELNISADRRLPEPVETAIYYTVSEALTNLAKHAHASGAQVDVTMEERAIRLLVRDDGVGGAHLNGGSGLVGLKDRVEALGGRINLSSPAGGGTSLLVDIPTEPAS